MSGVVGVGGSATMSRRKTDDPETERRKRIRNNFSRLVNFIVSASSGQRPVNVLFVRLYFAVKSKRSFLIHNYDIVLFLIYIYNKTQFQSQEVTYAELTMPRNKGYAPMRARSTESPVNNVMMMEQATSVANQNCLFDGGFNGGGGVPKSTTFKIVDKPRPPAPPPRYTSPPTRASAPSNGDPMSEMPLVSAASCHSVFSPSFCRNNNNNNNSDSDHSSDQGRAHSAMRRKLTSRQQRLNKADSEWADGRSLPDTMDVREKRRVMMVSVRGLEVGSIFE